jgi:hypothetical protein
LLTNWLLLIHAENFMTGLKVVFDRERSVLGWQKFDCKFIIAVQQEKEQYQCLIDEIVATD